MTEGEIDKFLIEFGSGLGSCRHIRIIHPHDLDALQVHGLERIEIGQPSVFFLKVIGQDFCFDQI